MFPLLLAAVSPAFQDTAALDRAVAAFTTRPMGSEGGARTAVDPRLRLAQCPMVALSWRTEAKDAVVVTCSGPDWRIFVPVTRSVPLVSPRPTPAVATPMPAVPAKVEPVIRRGDPVVIEAGSDGFAISREGIAMADAAPGARLLVRVDDAAKLVQAVAVESGRATLPGW